MRFIEQLSAAASALFISIAAASPIELEQRDFSKKAFTIHQSDEPKEFIQSGPAAVLSTYEKFGKTAPQDVVTAAAANNGVVTASPAAYDSQYLTPVNIGGQTVNLDIDTGSADLWVFSSLLSATDTAGHEVYDPSRSTTAVQKEGYTWSIRYGDGSGAGGEVYTDTVNVGGTSVTGQAVEVATRISGQFRQDVDSDGLLGLSFSSGNTVKPTKQLTFFDNAKSTLSDPLFTVDLKKNAPGSYNFGFIDNSKFTGSITYVPVDNSRGFWEFTGKGYSVGSNGSFKSVSIDAIADTGTSLLYLPDAVVQDYYGAVPSASYSPSQGGYTFPCGTSLPSISLGIGAHLALIPGPFINYAPTDDSGSVCFGGIQSDAGIGFSIFGDILLKSQFVIFSSGDGNDQPRLGFAAKPL